MRITITIDASESEAAALAEQLREIFGDRMTVESGESAGPDITAQAESAITAVPVSIAPPEAAPPPRDPGRGQLFRNAQFTGEPVAYGERQAGPAEWTLRDFPGESRPGGETQPVSATLLHAERSAGDLAALLSPAYAGTALEMGGAFRTMRWEIRQENVPVRAGYACDLEAVFHLLVKTRLGDGRVVTLGQAQSADWAGQLEWRWLVRAGDGQELAADEWRNGATLGRDNFSLPPDAPHPYRWRWQVADSAEVSVALQFRNTWALAETRVWLHEATCTEA